MGCGGIVSKDKGVEDSVGRGSSTCSKGGKGGGNRGGVGLIP